MSLELREDGEFLLIIDSETGREEHDIPKTLLATVRKECESECVAELRGRIWVTTEILYKLAAHIHSNCPDHKINWPKTFFTVEKANFLEEAGPLLKPDPNESKGGYSSLLNRIKLGMEQSNEETDKMINEIVLSRLKEYNLEQ